MPKRQSATADGQSSSIFEDHSCVKQALNRSCKEERVYKAIINDVVEMSSLFVEASRYIHFMLMKEWSKGVGFDKKPRFLDYYYCLLAGSKKKYVLDTEYKNLRGNMPLYDKTYRSNLFVREASHYETIFHNNLWMHAYSRIRKLMKKYPDDDKPTSAQIYATLNHLFAEKPNKNDAPHSGLLAFVLKVLDCPGGISFNKIQGKNFWQYVRPFYNLQRFNEENGFKNFIIIPQMKHGAHHVMYDSTSFFHLLCRLKIA